MIDRVHIVGFKSLADVDVRLRPLTVVIGPNTAGKSNLLDALALVTSLVSGKSVKDALEEGQRGAPFEVFHFPEEGLPGILHRASNEFTIEVDVTLADDVVAHVSKQIRDLRAGVPAGQTATPDAREPIRERRLRYRITIEGLPATGLFRVVDESLRALNRNGSAKESRQPFFEKDRNRIVVRLEGQGHPTYHDIGLDYAMASTRFYAPHYPHIAAFKEEVMRWHFYYLEPTRMKGRKPLQHAESIGPLGEALIPFLNYVNVNHPRYFASMSRALHTLIPSITGLAIDRTDEGYLQLNVMEGDVPFSSDLISDGTLRILALLALTSPASHSSVVGFEEPENGVHARRLGLIASIFRSFVQDGKSGRQAILTTHSPELLGHFSSSAVLYCRKVGRVTTFEEPHGMGTIFESNEVAELMAEGSGLLEGRYAARQAE